MWFFIVISCLIILYLFLIFPVIRKHPQNQNLKNLLVAHRGLHDTNQGIPENSILSFENAMKHGFAIEIDIHLTKDGHVVIFHDDSLKRMCGYDKIVEDTTLDELSECCLDGTKEKIPTLEQLLQIAGKTMLVIELKCTPKNYKSLCEKADEILQKYDVPYVVQSFNPLAIRWYKLNRPEVCRGQLSTNFLARNKNKIDILQTICGFLLLNFLSRPDFISYENKYHKSLARRICVKFGAIPAAWTIRCQKELDECLGKYDIYIFENFIPNKKV